MDFEILTKALLLAYDRVPEFHRKRFRTLSKANGETYTNFAFRLALLLKSWMDGKEAFDDVERMREVVKLEQFVNCLPVELYRWVVQKHPSWWLMLRDTLTSMLYYTSPLRWNKHQAKSGSMFQIHSLKEDTPFTIRRRGVDLTKDLIYEALHTASVVQDVIVMDILHRTVIQLSQL